MVWNTDAKPQHYAPFQHLYRPSHADYAYDAKYGIRNWQGGGRASARETIGRVAAGAIAKKLLREQCGTEIVAYVKQIHKIYADVDPTTVTQEQVEANIVRCPDPACVEEMIDTSSGPTPGRLARGRGGSGGAAGPQGWCRSSISWRPTSPRR
jgi:chorismate synthase